MIMDKIFNSIVENGALRSAELFVLERLSSKQYSKGGDPSINIGELMDSMDITMSPLLDQAIEDLIAQSLIHSSDGENYLITPDGIGELEQRKREAIPP